ncbi:DUF4179 domain-containing protein [Cohnella pontilimi]|uniref:DUF4179 domain-containing protein n=1 Tax=Cohnella pontilimi TaxID=2564100 RepID=A0A4U0FBG1_9BACL|nr:DUF4179 domain-containing protein [Cohnella pontilimi]TJY41514.1 DUF4179 domain-containing protein [Cohnella pontilimi]
MSSVNMDQMLRENAPQRISAIPPVVLERIERTLSGLPDRAVMRRRHKIRRWAYAVASMVVLGSAVAGFASFSTPEMQSQMRSLPVIGSLVPLPDSPYERSVKDQGIEFTIKDIIYDGFGLSIEYSLSSDHAIDGRDLEYELKVNGLPIQMAVHDKDGSGAVQVGSRKINFGHYEGVLETTLYNYRPASFNLSLEVTKIGIQTGKWSFAIPIEKTSKITVMEPDVSRTNSLFSMKIEKVSLSPVSTQVNLNYAVIDKSKSVQIGYFLVGDTGDVIDYDFFGFWDPNGVGADSGRYTSHLSPVPAGSRYLTIRPLYFVADGTPSYSSGVTARETMNRLPTQDDPIILPQGKAGRLLVTSVQYFPDRTVVRFRTEGSNPVQQSQMFWVEDEHGNHPKFVHLSKLNLNNKEQMMEFEPFPASGKLVFVTRPIVPLTFTPDMEMRINLPQ